MATFEPLKAAAADPSALAAEYRSARRFDVFRLGSEHLFFRVRTKVRYLAYAELRRCFRRVLLVPVHLSCCGGEMQVENLVLSDDRQELAVVLLREPRLAAPLVEELKKLAPHAVFAKPGADNGGNYE